MNHIVITQNLMLLPGGTVFSRPDRNGEFAELGDLYDGPNFPIGAAWSEWMDLLEFKAMEGERGQQSLETI